MHKHYALGKAVNYKGNFPHLCCGISGRNMLATLLMEGYPNATYFYDGENDHGYNGLPVIVGRKKGFLLLDPTSDQLWGRVHKKPKNLIFYAQGTNWEYETEWEDGKNLYPSEYLNLATLREDGLITEYYYRTDIEKYFRKVFEHPLRLETD